MAARKIPPLLVRARVGDEADQLVALDPAIVEQGVALGRGTVARDRCSGLALIEQKPEEIGADALDPRLERRMDRTLAQARTLLLVQHCVDGGRAVITRIVGMGAEDAERSAVGRK